MFEASHTDGTASCASGTRQSCSTSSSHTTSPGKGVVEVGSSCRIDMLLSGNPKVCTGKLKQFSVNGPCLENLTWSAPGGAPESGTGASFETAWTTPGMKTVTVSCGSTSRSATIEVIGAPTNVNVALVVQTQQPVLETRPPTPLIQGAGLRNLNCNWSCQLEPPSSGASVYTELQVQWNISTAAGISPQFTNQNTESYYFEGIVTGTSLNLSPDQFFNEGGPVGTFATWLQQRHNITIDDLNDINITPLERRDEIVFEYRRWFNSHLGGPVDGSVSIIASYKAFGCPAEETFLPPLGGNEWSTTGRDQLPHSYPYPRIPNVIRSPIHRQATAHSASAPTVWGDPALAATTVSFLITFSTAENGTTSLSSTISPPPPPNP